MVESELKPFLGSMRSRTLPVRLRLYDAFAVLSGPRMYSTFVICMRRGRSDGG